MSRFVRLVAPIVVLAFAACAGEMAPPSVPAVPTASSAGSKSGWPIDGASFSYEGTLQQTTAIGGRRARAAFGVSQRVRTSATSFEGRSVTDYAGTQTLSGSGPSRNATFDLFVAEVPSSIRHGDDVRLLKSSLDDASGQVVTRIGRGNGVVDQVPEVPQARWQNGAARTQTASASGTTLSDRYAADGSYAESESFAGGASASLAAYGDGSAVYQWPYQGGSRNSTITFSPPSRKRVQIVFTNVTGFPYSELFDVKVWYPNAPPVLASDSIVDAGVAQVPAACNAGARYGGDATELVENAVRLDVTYGQYETLTRTFWVKAPYGLVCLQTTDELQTYYDYTSFTFGSTPISDATASETLGLKAAHLPKGAQNVALPLDMAVSSVASQQRRKTARAIFEALRRLGKAGR